MSIVLRQKAAIGDKISRINWVANMVKAMVVLDKARI